MADSGNSHITVFLSAATLDLREWRDVLHGAFSRAGFRVLTQDQSLRSAPGNVKRLLSESIDEADCIIHLAGMGYGADADEPFPDAPAFQCSWTQFEYYHAHANGKDVIAFVCGPSLSADGFTEKGSPDDCLRKQRLQQLHRERVQSGKFDGTPLQEKIKRTSNEKVDSVSKLLSAVAAAVGTLHKMDGERCAKAQKELEDLASAVAKIEAGVGAANDKLDRILELLVPQVITAQTPAVTLHQLPSRPENFVGRSDDLAKLRTGRKAGAASISGIKGMGGIGKTALALVLAHEWMPDYPDAQFFLNGLGTSDNPPTGPALLAQVLQPFYPEAKLPESEKDLRAFYQQTLTGKRVLILLDNAKDAQQALPLVPPPGCALIVTSRHSFAIGNVAAIRLGELPEAEAIGLLRFLHAALNDSDAAELANRCAHLPLALKLAGTHLMLEASDRGTADVAGYLRQLRTGRLQSLDAEATDAGEIAISETLRLSEAALSPALRATWHKLSVFPAPFDAAAAQAITGADDAALQTLLRRSLIEADSKRYRLHDLAAEYARGKLGADARTTLRLEHARHYRGVLAEADRHYLSGGAGITTALALFDAERAQIENAHAWLLAAPTNDPLRNQRDELLIAYPDAGAYVLNLRQHAREQIAWLEACLAAARRVGDQRGEGNALGNLGIAWAALGDARKAIGFYEQVLSIDREIGDRCGEGNALGNLGLAWAALGDARKAIGFYEHQLAIVREIGDRRGEGNALGNLGNAWVALGDARKAIGFHEQALIISREIGDRRGEGSDLGNLGIAWQNLGDARKAIGFYEQVLSIHREIGDRRGEGTTVGNLGIAWKNLGEARKAIGFYEQQLVIAREIGDRGAEGAALGNLGLAWKNLGDARRAIEFYEEQLLITREIGDRRGEATTLFNSALAYELLNQPAEALPLAQQAEAIFTAIESPHAEQSRQLVAQLRQAVSGAS